MEMGKELLNYLRPFMYVYWRYHLDSAEHHKAVRLMLG